MSRLSTAAWANHGTHLSLYSTLATVSEHVSFIPQVGRLDSEKPAAIRLSGDNILEEHCFFDNADGKVTLSAQPNSTTVRTWYFVFSL